MRIQIDQGRNALLSEFALATLAKSYCLPGEGPQEAFARAATAFSGGDDKLAQRLYDYASKQWFMFATPLLANGGTKKGLPISCFLNYVHDSIRGLADNFVENAYLSTNGGGIGTYWGAVRSIGEMSTKGVDTPGALAFMHVQDSQVIAYHQGSTRRGAAAAYMDISHPEIVEFINMRSPTGGDVHRKNENMHHGVCIPDAFMEAVEKDGDWHLIDPHSGETKQTVKARSLWIQVLQQRARLGEPYLFFVDAANRALPKRMQEEGLRVHHSNLCTEITLPTDHDYTAVCCLSSLNVAKLDEYEDKFDQVVADLVRMLDNALLVFEDSAPPEMFRALQSVHLERSIGLGTLGFVTYCQQNGWALDSREASDFNRSFYARLWRAADTASRHLGSTRGEPYYCKGTGRRNAHLIAIAPNATSSIICGGVSPSTEPLVANAFTQKTRTGSGVMKNGVLAKLLEAKGFEGDQLEAIWRDIFLSGGSVQGLPDSVLSQQEKAVFRTAAEIDPMVLIQLAADRQPHICQAQSLNLFFPANASTRAINQAHMAAWRKGLKSLYYLRSSSVKATSVGVMPEIEIESTKLACSLDNPDACKACEG